MAYTEVTSRSWMSRLMESIKGVLVGLVLFLLAFPLLFWNEGRAVRTAQSLAEGKGAVITVPADPIDAANEGALIHLSGQATTDEELSDGEFRITASNVLRFRRNVEMYQWQENESRETRKKVGGGEETITTYTYNKTWSPEHLDSTRFRERGHDNPPSMPFTSHLITSENATVGAFRLGSLTQTINAWSSLPLNSEEALSSMPGDLRSKFKMHNSGLYQGTDPSQPNIGDLRINFEVVRPTAVSVVAVQQGENLVPYVAKKGGTSIHRLMLGEHSAEGMFAQMEAENVTLTWILRAVGFMMMIIGISLIFRPFAVMGDVIPMIGTLLSTGIGFFAFAVAAPLSLVTIGIAWIVYRPLLGGLLLAAAGGIIYMAYTKAKQNKAS